MDPLEIPDHQISPERGLHHRRSMTYRRPVGRGVGEDAPGPLDLKQRSRFEGK
jgi:hypothetical protein